MNRLPETMSLKSCAYRQIGIFRQNAILEKLAPPLLGESDEYRTRN